MRWCEKIEDLKKKEMEKAKFGSWEILIAHLPTFSPSQFLNSMFSLFDVHLLKQARMA